MLLPTPGLARPRLSPPARQLLARSRLRCLVELKESDAATANFTVVNNDHATAAQWHYILAAHMRCLLHQLHLVVGLELILLSGKRLVVVGLYPVV